jgi:hypothetical protein
VTETMQRPGTGERIAGESRMSVLRKLSAALLVLVTLNVAAALPATDAFTAANGTALTTYSAQWAYQSDAAFEIRSNGVSPQITAGSLEGGAYWIADTPSDDQYAEVTIGGVGGVAAIGPAVRVSTSADTRYGLYTDGSGTFLFKVVAGTFIQLGSNGGSCSPGDVLRLEVSGTTLTAKKNGSPITAIAAGGQWTDSSIANGQIGITGYGEDDLTYATSWEGGNLGGGGTVVNPISGRGGSSAEPITR